MNTPRRMLDEISTRWPMIHDPAQFVLRYAPAIEGYLLALVRDPDQVDEIRQDFLVKVLQKGFGSEINVKGRFRNYLKAAVRNAAITHLRRKAPGQADPAALAQVADDAETPAAEAEWLEQWRRCMLERIWEALEMHERQNLDNHAYTVLNIYIEHSEQEDSEQLAATASARIGKPMRPDAFRKQLSRARRLFAKLLIQEIVQTLESPTPERIEDELAEVGLLSSLRPFLPEDWREQINRGGVA
ncbi:MAG: sigma-70 family RNA polymerase sigma factor [Planctomycetes bacterium]|nr:sigma-70 family RNA polymerase sigma factor [Planctomycetota bacterium]